MTGNKDVEDLVQRLLSCNQDAGVFFSSDDGRIYRLSSTQNGHEVSHLSNGVVIYVELVSAKESSIKMGST